MKNFAIDSELQGKSRHQHERVKDPMLTIVLWAANEKQDKRNLGPKGLSDSTKIDNSTTQDHDQEIFLLLVVQFYKDKQVNKVKYKHFDANLNEHEFSMLISLRIKVLYIFIYLFIFVQLH